VRLAAPASHLVEVELTFAPPAGGDHADVTMAAWCPGSYLIRDYARFVRDLAASDASGRTLAVRKLDKQTWRVACQGAGEVRVRYVVYGHDLTVRTNHIDAEHAFLHGPATFAYPVALRGAPIEVAIDAPAGWDIVTGAPNVDGDSRRLCASSIDELFDQPIHIGPVRMYRVAAKVTTRLAIWGPRAPGGMFNEARLAEDLAAVVDDHVARFGEAPFLAYTFMLMLTHEGYGGLEHRASSVNLYHPHFGASRKAYEGLLELLSHELFHAWNGKRIAPRALLDFDYAREAYTPCLWVMEGVTSHYDRFALRSSGRISAKSLLEKVLDDWARLVATPGRAKHSLEAASFDAWIKLYKPDESNVNTTVSYYLKGGLAMFALDLHIRRRSDGQKSLDDVLRALWQQFGARGEPHPDDVLPSFEQATGLSLGELFARQIRGTDDPELAQELAHVGLALRGSADPAQVTDGAHAVWLGVTTSGTKITAVYDDSPAQRAGLSPGDELVAVDRFQVANDGELRTLVNARAPGDTLALALFRRHRLVDVTATLAAAPPTRWEIAGVAEAGAAAARYEAWLGEPHPGAQVVATVTTTSRWL
jgi:predicted metalloprotease with PDZ domain